MGYFHRRDARTCQKKLFNKYLFVMVNNPLHQFDYSHSIFHLYHQHIHTAHCILCPIFNIVLWIVSHTVADLCLCAIISPESKISIGFHQFKKAEKKNWKTKFKSNLKCSISDLPLEIHSFVFNSKIASIAFVYICIVYSVADWNAIVCDSDSCVPITYLAHFWMINCGKCTNVKKKTILLEFHMAVVSSVNVYLSCCNWNSLGCGRKKICFFYFNRPFQSVHMQI